MSDDGLLLSCLGCVVVLAIIGACAVLALLFKFGLWALA